MQYFLYVFIFNIHCKVYKLLIYQNYSLQIIGGPGPIAEVPLYDNDYQQDEPPNNASTRSQLYYYAVASCTWERSHITHRQELSPGDIYLLHSPSGLYVWVGEDASWEGDRSNRTLIGETAGKNFVNSHFSDTTNQTPPPLLVLTDTSREDGDFLAYFSM